MGMSMPVAVTKDGSVIRSDAGSLSGQPIRIPEKPGHGEDGDEAISVAKSLGSLSRHTASTFLRARLAPKPLPGRTGLPVFAEPLEEEVPPTALELRVEEAREYIRQAERAGKGREGRPTSVSTSR